MIIVNTGCEYALASVTRLLKKQTRLNTVLLLCLVSSLAAVYIKDAKLTNAEGKINELSKEIDELKNTEGV